MKKVLNIRRYKAGYEVRTELIDGKEFGCPDFEIKSAYTAEGHYIGDSRMAHMLCKKRGIKPELSVGSVCSIGFCEREQKWYGWSHRAIFGFGIGDEVKEGDLCAESGYMDEYIAEHPEEDRSLPVGFKAANLQEAKLMAEAFADSVS